MLKINLKNRFYMSLFAVMTGGLTLLPTVANASVGGFNALAKGSDTTIYNFSHSGLTKYAFVLANNDKTGAWLLLNETSGNVAEDFQFIIQQTDINADPIDKVFVQLFKLDNNFDYKPNSSDWIIRGDSFSPSNKPGLSSVDILEDTDNSFRFVMNMVPGIGSLGSVTFDLSGDDPTTVSSGRFDDVPWLNFNNGGQFLLNIDFNEVDDNLDLSQFRTPSNVPLPPAVWMFGSALIGLVSFPRRRGDRA